MDDELGGIHIHCSTCYSFKFCSKSDENNCEFTTCSCGSVLHSCKLREHLQEICPLIQVPCLNQQFGCPKVLQRRNLGVHLEKCVGNVVLCMAEWNRWPVYCSERQKTIPFSRNPLATKGQLDYDLTMRDQRMLEGFGTLRRKTRLALCNKLTRRYPAVPLTPVIIHDDDDDDVMVTSQAINNGIGHFKKPDALSKQMQRWQDELDKRLKDKVIPPKYWEYPELEKGDIHGDHCSTCFNPTCGIETCRIIQCRYDCGSLFHGCKSSEHSIICPKYEVPDEYDWMYRGVSNARTKKKAVPSFDRAPVQSQHILTESVSKKMVKGPNGVLIPEAPPIPPSEYLSDSMKCRLDVRLDSVTRSQTKPRTMYTFFCAQEFRRDQIHDHCRNIHGDIFGGLNNWMESRCPLSVFGCGFSVRRMAPINKFHKIVFNTCSESFGIKYSGQVSDSATENQEILLTDLPYDVLDLIFQKLDSFRYIFKILSYKRIVLIKLFFSLNNLSLTCIYFRDICCSLLDDRGCVSIQWERKKKNNGITWQIAHKVINRLIIVSYSNNFVFRGGFIVIRSTIFGNGSLLRSGRLVIT